MLDFRTFKTLTLMEFAGKTENSKARADQAAATLNELLKDNVQLHEIQLQQVEAGKPQGHDGAGADL